MSRHHKHPSLETCRRSHSDRIAHRRNLQGQLDKIRRNVTADTFDAWDSKSKQAFTLLTNKQALESLDLTKESTELRENYGQSSFGQSLLPGRVALLKLKYLCQRKLE